MSGALMAGLARWCVRRRRLAVAGWLLTLVVLTVVSQMAGISYATRFSLPNSPATQALALVPALMHLIGPANWWFPDWFDRLLPTSRSWRCR